MAFRPGSSMQEGAQQGIRAAFVGWFRIGYIEGVFRFLNEVYIQGLTSFFAVLYTAFSQVLQGRCRLS